jgi:hypothetical protein
MLRRLLRPFRNSAPRVALSCGALVAFLALPGAASGTTITYIATDLADTTPGEDLWSYSYTVSDFSFPAGFGFAVLFELGLYGDLQDPPPAPNSDWDLLTFQPDANLPSDGLYDALGLVADPSLADSFTLSFVWLGSGSPGSQLFAVYDDAFEIVETGSTVALPEAGGAMLLPLVLASMLVPRRRP